MIDKILYRLNLAGLFIAGLAILVITLLGGADIISSAIFGRPIPAVFEATQTLMVIATFLGLGMVHLRGSHISADIGYDAMPETGKRISEAVTLIMMLAFFGALSWRGWEAAMKSWHIGEYSPGIIQFPVYPARFALAIGCSLALLCCVSDLLRGGRFRRHTITEKVDVEDK